MGWAPTSTAGKEAEVALMLYFRLRKGFEVYGGFTIWIRIATVLLFIAPISTRIVKCHTAAFSFASLRAFVF